MADASVFVLVKRFSTSYGSDWKRHEYEGRGGAFYSDLSWGTPGASVFPGINVLNKR